MNYAASVTDFFKSSKWFMNMLRGAVCVLIPLLGMILIFGWLIEGLWTREEENFETFPPFEFSKMERYLELGLWPGVVMFLGALVMMPLLGLPLIAAGLAGVIWAEIGGQASFIAGAATVCGIVWLVAGVMVIQVTSVPIMIRATLTQEFRKVFDFRFLKQFVRLTWKELVAAAIFLLAISLLLTFFGALAFCVGIYLASVVSYFAWMHLQKQLYLLYLSRGGEPVPRKAALERVMDF